MTDHIEDGGPAFAQEQWNPDREMFMVTGGMTLRDYFATHANEQDILFWLNEVQSEETIVEDGAGQKHMKWGAPLEAREKARYLHADAMLKARKP